jgi:hypothetical protein
MSEVQIDIATLGTRQEVKKVKATLAVTQGADTTTTLAVTFDNEYVNIPEILGVVCTDAAAIKANFAATDITTTGMNVSAYQVLAADLVTGSYVVEVTLEGWKKA